MKTNFDTIQHTTCKRGRTTTYITSITSANPILIAPIRAQQHDNPMLVHMD